MEEGQKVFPGQFLGYIYDYAKGENGIFQKEDRLYASLTGKVKIDHKTVPPTLSIINKLNETQIKPNDEVYARILKVQKTQATCEIFANKNEIVRTVQGLIKHENIKKDFKDFDIFSCLVPGDIVFAKVISVDQSNYIYLSIAEAKFGVVFAKSQLSGELMMPVSFEQMECLETHTRESRKVAKPDYAE